MLGGIMGFMGLTDTLHFVERDHRGALEALTQRAQMPEHDLGHGDLLFHADATADFHLPAFDLI